MDFKSASHTVILSDIHLSDEEPLREKKQLWKKFKTRPFFIDDEFKSFLDYIQENAKDRIELILNGDIFDFDSVLKRPAATDRFHLTWLEKLRGMAAEEHKSVFKIQTIMEDHSTWVRSISQFIKNGNCVVFVIGNHDMELHWPKVQTAIIEGLNLTDEEKLRVRFVEWFYISNGDTLIEHGNQYDAYCLCSNPINPLIKKGTHTVVRLPFGNLAGKYILNGMGLMNPHADSSYIKESFWDYIVFFFKYFVRTQPFLAFTWFWSAMVTLIYSIGDGFLPAMRDPLTIDQRIEDIASRSNATSHQVWSMKELHVHPAIFNPYKILKELWLDRALFLVGIFFICFETFTVMHTLDFRSLWWLVLPAMALLPVFIFYAKSIESDVNKVQKAAFKFAPFTARLARVKRVVHGHTHREMAKMIEGVEYFNTGTWSPAYEDVECTKPYGRKCFVWLKPQSQQNAQIPGRVAELFEWKNNEIVKLSTTADVVKETSPTLKTASSF